MNGPMDAHSAVSLVTMTTMHEPMPVWVCRPSLPTFRFSLIYARRFTTIRPVDIVCQRRLRNLQAPSTIEGEVFAIEGLELSEFNKLNALFETIVLLTSFHSRTGPNAYYLFLSYTQKTTCGCCRAVTL
jgi:hypothetical protein